MGIPRNSLEVYRLSNRGDVVGHAQLLPQQNNNSRHRGQSSQGMPDETRNGSLSSTCARAKVKPSYRRYEQVNAYSATKYHTDDMNRGHPV